MLRALHAEPDLLARGRAPEIPGEVDPGIDRLPPVRVADDAAGNRSRTPDLPGRVRVALQGSGSDGLDLVVALLDARTGTRRATRPVRPPSPPSLTFEAVPPGRYWVCYGIENTSLRFAYFQRTAIDVAAGADVAVRVDLTLHDLQLLLVPPAMSDPKRRARFVPITPELRRVDDEDWRIDPSEGRDLPIRTRGDAATGERPFPLTLTVTDDLIVPLMIQNLGAGEYRVMIAGFEPDDPAPLTVTLPAPGPVLITGRLR